MIRPHEIRPGMRFEAAPGHYRIARSHPLPNIAANGGALGVVVLTDSGPVRWSLDAAHWPTVKIVPVGEDRPC